MEHSKKTCVHDSVVVALTAGKEKCLNYKTSANGQGCQTFRD